MFCRATERSTFLAALPRRCGSPAAARPVIPPSTTKTSVAGGMARPLSWCQVRDESGIPRAPPTTGHDAVRFTGRVVNHRCPASAWRAAALPDSGAPTVVVARGYGGIITAEAAAGVGAGRPAVPLLVRTVVGAAEARPPAPGCRRCDEGSEGQGTCDTRELRGLHGLGPSPRPAGDRRTGRRVT